MSAVILANPEQVTGNPEKKLFIFSVVYACDATSVDTYIVQAKDFEEAAEMVKDYDREGRDWTEWHEVHGEEISSNLFKYGPVKTVFSWSRG